MIFNWRVLHAALFTLLPIFAFAQAPKEVVAEDAAAAGTVKEEKIERRTIVEQMLNGESFRNTLEVIERYVDSDPASLMPTTAGVNARTLTVRQCVEMALSQNPQVFVAEADVEAARAKIGQARARHLPQVTVGVAETWNDRLSYDENGFSLTDLTGGSSLGGSGFGGGGLGGIGGIGGGFGGGGFGGNPVTSFIVFLAGQNLAKQIAKDYIPQQDTFSQTLTISQTLYTGGQISAAIRASEALANSQEFQHQATLQDIEYQSKQSFFDVLLAQALVRVAEESVKTFERNLSDAQEMFNVGMISNFEVLRAQTELGNRQAEYVQARNGLRLADTNLHRILSLPQDTPIVLDASLDWLPNPLPVSYYIEQAKNARPEILGIQQAIEASKQDIRRIKGSYKPQIGAKAEYQNTQDAGPAVPDGWVVNVGAQWEIAAGGRRKFERKEAEARQRSVENQYKDLLNLVELDVTQAFIQIQDSMAEIKRTRGTVELAREGLSIAELRFQQGVGTQSETLDAELALTNAETGLVRAIRNYAVGNAALERAIGKSWMKPEADALAAKADTK